MVSGRCSTCRRLSYDENYRIVFDAIKYLVKTNGCFTCRELRAYVADCEIPDKEFRFIHRCFLKDNVIASHHKDIGCNISYILTDFGNSIIRYPNGEYNSNMYINRYLKKRYVPQEDTPSS